MRVIQWNGSGRRACLKQLQMNKCGLGKRGSSEMKLRIRKIMGDLRRLFLLIPLNIMPRGKRSWGSIPLTLDQWGKTLLCWRWMNIPYAEGSHFDRSEEDTSEIQSRGH